LQKKRKKKEREREKARKNCENARKRRKKKEYKKKRDDIEIGVSRIFAILSRIFAFASFFMISIVVCIAIIFECYRIGCDCLVLVLTLLCWVGIALGFVGNSHLLTKSGVNSLKNFYKFTLRRINLCRTKKLT
jgi:hypothetical protein